jgi:predicted  nucleic acid-binding Zn-ribbon protein
MRDLLVLQDRDIRLAKAERELQHIPLEIEQVERRLKEQSKQLEELKAATRQIEADRKKLELEVGTKRTQIGRYKTQQLETRKNEEFAALNHEIERAEKDISGLDDQQIELMEKYEAAQKEVAVEADKVKQFENAANVRKGELKGKEAGLKAQLEEMKAKVAEAEAVIEPVILGRYRRILASKKDAAIAQVVHDDTCGGCHMKLTHQTALSARGGASLVACDDCGRLLYWPEG